ncbi:MAG: ATP-binding protein [Betaproteobacteria bacterium]
MRLRLLPFPYLKAFYCACFRSHLSLALGMAILLLGITGGITTYLLRSDIDERFSSTAALAQQQMNAELSHFNRLVEGHARSAVLYEALTTGAANMESLQRATLPGGPLGWHGLESMTIHNPHGRALTKNDNALFSAGLYNALLADIISTGKPDSLMDKELGVSRYLLGYPIFQPGNGRLLGVLMAEVNLALLAKRAIDLSKPGLMVELQMNSDISTLRLGVLPNGDERLSVTLALDQNDNLLPPFVLTFSQSKSEVLKPLIRLRFLFLLLLFLVVGITAYLSYRITRSSGGFTHCNGSVGWIPCAAKLTQQMLLKERAVMASSNGILIVNMARRQMRVEFVNPAFERITGYSGAEIIGLKLGVLTGKDTDQAGLRELRKAVQDELSITVTLRNYRKDGTLFWSRLAVSPVYDTKCHLTHYIGILNDITALKQAEQRLLATNAQLDLLCTMSDDGMLTFNEKNCLSYANDAFLQQFGLTFNDVIGADLQVLEDKLAAQCDPDFPYPLIAICPHDASAREACSYRKPVDGDLICNCVSEIRISHPQRRTLLRITHPGEHGVNQLIYFKDVTAVREIEEIKSEFMATAAHELRTPMASILGFSELLLQRDYDSECSRDLLEIIASQSRRITNLLNELLDLARIEARQGKDFDLAVQNLKFILRDVVAEALEPLGRIVVDLPDGLVQAKVDKQKIHQALSNLLSNALKYSSPGQSVSVSMRLMKDEKPPRVMIAFKDRGIGMSPEQVLRYGERFWRADPSGSVHGSGLGVTLVKEIVQLHGGSFEVDSVLGEGSCMTVHLPIEELEEEIFVA